MKTLIHLASVHSFADLVGPLKRTLHQQLSREFRADLPAALVRRILDEAEAVARETGFPHLFLPELALEQIRHVHSTLIAESTSRPYRRAA